MVIMITFFIIVILLVRTLLKFNIHRKAYLNAIKVINKNFRELFIGENNYKKILQCFMIIFSEIFSFIVIYNLIMKYSNNYIKFNLNYFIKILIIIIIFLIIHYSMGYLMVISSKMYSFLYRSEEESLKFDFLLSYFLTTAYLIILILFPKSFYSQTIAGIIGIGICYFLNMKILLNVMKNPKSIKLSIYDSSSFSRIFFAAITISFMIIINLYLAVCIVHIVGQGGFSNNPGYFDLFYYTVITFTTIGFGDIIPLTIGAKFIAIIISITSVICLTVFLGSIFSYRGN